jgi:hypothetical protein
MPKHAKAATAQADAPDMDGLVSQYHYQLVCLEADLKDRARAGLLSAREFASRSRRLKSVQKELDQLRKFSVAETPGALSDTDIGLPVLDNCTPAEQETCERCMIEKEVELLRIEQDTTRAHAWLRDAVAGKSGSIMLTLRLSALRRMIHGYTKLFTQAESESAQLDQHTLDLAKSLKFKRSEGAARSSLQTLMSLFSELESVITRVARLRTTLRNETAKVAEMNAWLQREQQRFDQGLTARKPPTPLTLARSAIAGFATGSGLSRKSMERRRLVEQFWRDVIIQRQPGAEKGIRE